MRYDYWLIGILGLFVLGLSAQSFTYVKEAEQIESFVTEGMELWKVPGMTVTVVKDGDVILSKGFGVKNAESSSPVDENTLFVMASTTKAVTAHAMAILVDEGKVHWDDRVIDHLPTFRLHDPYPTRELRVKDLFTHNSGLGYTDMLWTLWDYSPEEIIQRLQYEEPRYSFRGGYNYQNIMYLTAGLVIEKVSGLSWAEFVTQRLFDPIGMSRTMPLKELAYKDENRVTPHGRWKGDVVPVIDSEADSIDAAGSGWICAADAAKWLQFLTDSARVDGERLISKDQFEFIHRPHIILPYQRFYASKKLTKPHFTSYGLGWYHHDYDGEIVQFHTGSLNGAVAICGLMPEHRIGVYVTGNLGGAEVRHSIMYKVFDVLLGKNNIDWQRGLYDIYQPDSGWSEERQKERSEKRVANTSPTLPLEKLEGTYKNEFLGSFQVGQIGDRLQFTFRDDRHLVLDHWHYDTFLAKIEEYATDSGSFVMFQFDGDFTPAIDLYGYIFEKVD